MQKRFFIQLSYDGTDFHGWQRQDNASSVQQEIESKLSIVLQQEIDLVGCGRTDTGVHASKYFAHFETEKPIDQSELTYKLNCMLPPSIAIQQIFSVDNEAHARFDATARSYEYYVSTVKDPFRSKYVFEFKQALNIEEMNECAKYLLTVEDFGSFCKAGSDNKTTICNVTNAVWKQLENGYTFYITADRFLRNMVRAIVGTLLDVGQGKINRYDFVDIVKKGQRSEAGSSAPASGLFLTDIVYPKYIFEV